MEGCGGRGWVSWGLGDKGGKGEGRGAYVKLVVFARKAVEEEVPVNLFFKIDLKSFVFEW